MERAHTVQFHVIPVFIHASTQHTVKIAFYFCSDAFYFNLSKPSRVKEKRKNRPRLIKKLPWLSTCPTQNPEFYYALHILCINPLVMWFPYSSCKFLFHDGFSWIEDECQHQRERKANYPAKWLERMSPRYPKREVGVVDQKATWLESVTWD